MRIAIVLAAVAAVFALALPAAAAPGGHIAFRAAIVDSNSFWRSTIDVANADGSGHLSLPVSGGYPAWSPDGSKIAFSGGESSGDIFVMDADGSNIRQVTHESGYHWSLQPTWSPDGARLAFAHGVDGACCHIAVVNVDGSDQHEITGDNPDGSNFVADAPTWSADGRWIAFVGDQSGEDVEIYAVTPGGSDLHEITDNPDGVSFGPAWSPDGSRLAFVAQRADGSAEVDLIDADGTNLVELPDGDATAWDGHPAWSPDGSQLVFESMRDGRPTTDLYVINADGTGLKPLIQTDGVFETDASWGR